MLKSKDGWTMGSASWDAELRYLGSGKGPDTLHYSRGHFPHRVMVPEMKKELQRGWLFIDLLRTACLCVCLSVCWHVVKRLVTFPHVWCAVKCLAIMWHAVNCATVGLKIECSRGEFCPAAKWGLHIWLPASLQLFFTQRWWKQNRKIDC